MTSTGRRRSAVTPPKPVPKPSRAKRTPRRRSTFSRLSSSSRAMPGPSWVSSIIRDPGASPCRVSSSSMEVSVVCDRSSRRRAAMRTATDVRRPARDRSAAWTTASSSIQRPSAAVRSPSSATRRNSAGVKSEPCPDRQRACADRAVIRPSDSATTGWCRSANSLRCRAVRSRAATSARRTTSCCIWGAYSSTRSLPAALARYIARSALRRSSPAPRPGSAKATPMEAATRTSLPSMSYGWESRSRSRSASSTMCRSRAARSLTPSPMISAANSSPPSRAAVSPLRTASCSRRAAWTRSSSPAWWPMVSLTALKPSRSMKSTAVPWSEVRRPASACPTRRVNRARLGRSVSGSCSALCCNWACRRTRSVTSRLLRMRPPWCRLTVDSTLSQPPPPDRNRYSIRVVGSAGGPAARKRRSSCRTPGRSSGWISAASSRPTSSCGRRP